MDLAQINILGNIFKTKYQQFKYINLKKRMSDSWVKMFMVIEFVQLCAGPLCMSLGESKICTEGYDYRTVLNES